MKLRYAGHMPDDENEAKQQIEEHARFLRELSQKEYEKDDTISLAQSILEKAHPDAISVIKHWISIIQSRWEEVSSWALQVRIRRTSILANILKYLSVLQRESKLKDHMQSLHEMEDILEELLAWLGGLERTLQDLEAEDLPEEPELIEGLIKDHTEFMENTAKRQTDVDGVCKPRQIQAPNPTKQPATLGRKGSKPKTSIAYVFHIFPLLCYRIEMFSLVLCYLAWFYLVLLVYFCCVNARVLILLLCCIQG